MRRLASGRQGDIEINLRRDPALYAYMLQHGGLNNYAAPFYSPFEGAMNQLANPLVNDMNNTNPLLYSQSIFGTNITINVAKCSIKSKYSTK